MRKRARVDQNQSEIVKALRSMEGSANPNWRGGNGRTCEGCGGSYNSYNKRSKYCTRKCYFRTCLADILKRGLRGADSQRGKKKYYPCVICAGPRNRDAMTCSRECRQLLPRKSRPRWAKPPEPNKVCSHCGSSYHSYVKTRRFCSYACHLRSGGALRAGAAAAVKRMKYGAKKDANHNEIVGALRDMGLAVYDLSGAGCGVPDCLVWLRTEWVLVEIKNPKTGYGRRGLNKLQKNWIEQWQGGPVYILHSIEEAIMLANGRREEVEVVASGGSRYSQ